jgi:hypothetical protein
MPFSYIISIKVEEHGLLGHSGVYFADNIMPPSSGYKGKPITKQTG